MSFAGTLEGVTLEEVLLFLELLRKTGELHVRSQQAGDDAVIQVTKGMIVGARRRGSRRKIGELLVRAGYLTERNLEIALRQQSARPDLTLADILAGMGCVSDEQLQDLLRLQLEETAYEILSWRDGIYRFLDKPAPTHRIMISITITALLMESAQRTDEWPRLNARIPSAECVPVLATAVAEQTAHLELSVGQWELLGEVDGQRDVRNLAACVGRTAFETATLLCDLIDKRVAELL